MHRVNIDNNNDFDYLFKFVVIGDSGVGKTNIIKRFQSDEFDPNSRSTVGFEFVSKELYILDKKIKIQIWDTAGQERYKSITSGFYKSSSGILCVFDITKFISFENVDDWIKEARLIAGENTPAILIGNKSDLKNARCVNKEDALKKVDLMKFDGYIETSALMNIRIEEPFKKLTSSILLPLICYIQRIIEQIGL